MDYNKKALEEAREQAKSKLELEKQMQYDLEKLLRKSPTEITHDEMMFVLDNMNLEAVVAAAMERQNLVTKKKEEE